MKMNKFSLQTVAIFALALGLPQLLQSAKPAKTVSKKPEKVAPAPTGIPAGQSYFVPTERLPGIGLGRQDMTEKELERRINQLVESQTFYIMRDPKAVWGAENVSSPELQEIFNRAARENDFPKPALEAIVLIESWGDANAQSPTGAQGIMQIIWPTAKRIGLKKYNVTEYRMVPQRKPSLPPKKKAYQVEIDERLDPEKAIPAAARYLSKLSRDYGSVEMAVWAYHSGEGYPNKALALAKKYGIDNPTMGKLFFGNSPVWRTELFNLLEKDMKADYGPNYWFCVKRAEQLLKLYRQDPQSYKALAQRFVNTGDPTQRAPTRLYVWPPPTDTETAGGLEYIGFETRRLWEALHPKGQKFVPLEATIHGSGALDISWLRLPKLEANCLKFVVDDLGYGEHISYFLETSGKKKALHFGVSPHYKDFFTKVFEEAKTAYQLK